MAAATYRGEVATGPAMAPVPSPVVAARALVKNLGGRAVVRGISLTVPPGHAVCLLGPNGAGKTTLLRLLGCLLAPDGGRLEWFGGVRELPSIRRRIGYVGHATYLYRSLTARENLLYYAKLYRVPNPRQRAEELLRRFGLGRQGDVRVEAFSRGMSQRLTLARALLAHPTLLLLDEPEAGLDRSGRALVGEVLQEVREEGGGAVLSAHDVPWALGLAQEVLVVGGGRPVFQGPGGDPHLSQVLAMLGLGDKAPC